MSHRASGELRSRTEPGERAAVIETPGASTSGLYPPLRRGSAAREVRQVVITVDRAPVIHGADSDHLWVDALSRDSSGLGPLVARCDYHHDPGLPRPSNRLAEGIVTTTAAGTFHNCVLVKIKKRYPGQARKVISGMWGMGLMMLAKTIIVVDEHMNLDDYNEVFWYVSGNIDPKRDVFFAEGPVDDLDHASPVWRYGSKMGIDATKKWPQEGHPRECI